ncbi:MAG: hypothetical protein AAF501_04265 [Pseudomonadota bacterium]
MSGDLQRLLILHDLASPFGSGLKPELEILLRGTAEAAAQGAIPLPVAVHSAGPSEQHATAEQLLASDVHVLGRSPAADPQPVEARR